MARFQRKYFCPPFSTTRRVHLNFWIHNKIYISIYDDFWYTIWYLAKCFQWYSNSDRCLNHTFSTWYEARSNSGEIHCEMNLMSVAYEVLVWWRWVASVTGVFSIEASGRTNVNAAWTALKLRWIPGACINCPHCLQ